MPWKNANRFQQTIPYLDSGADSNQTTVDSDFPGIKVKIDGTQFTFENNGGFTLNLVSLRISNSTDHQRYHISVFINSADTKLSSHRHLSANKRLQR